MPSGTHLEIDQLVVNYGAQAVLKQVSLTVEHGEFVALLGASGCGKTTLLRAISGFAAVAAGRISVASLDITRLPPDKRDMAMVFQSYALWPHMSVAQNIAYGLKLRGQRRTTIKTRVEEILQMLGLDGLGARKVTQLSGGQRQRVALGRALAVNPRILLLDEPLSNLDARIRQVVRHEIKALQEKLAITTIHVTHDREEAMVMADRIVILNEGAIVQQGAPEDVYNRPASPFVATFMGADNVIELRVSPHPEALHVAPNAHSSETLLPLSQTTGDGGLYLSQPIKDAARAHFRSEAATLLMEQQTLPDSLVLHGHIMQASYPGGFYRYAVAVGEQRFMVDDARRLNVGSAVSIGVPAAALHVFPAMP